MTRKPLTIAFAVLPLCACSPSNQSPNAPAVDPIHPIEKFFPLQDGHTYTYETLREDTGERDMFMIRVRRTNDQSAELGQGESTKHLVIGPDFVRRAGGGFVLKKPLRTGATWIGDNGGKTRIEAVDVRVSVPAGTYEGCLRTVEESDTADRVRVTTVFCPDVGIVEMKVEKWAGSEHGVQRAALRSFGPPVDVDTLK